MALVEVKAGYYSGRRPDERPLWFELGGERIEVERLVSETLEEGPGRNRIRRFRVRAAGGREFTLVYDGESTYLVQEELG